MVNRSGYRRGSTMGALVLIAIGGLFLYANLQPSFNPWLLLARYWPVLIILWGVRKLTDYLRFRGHPEAAASTRITGGEIVGVVFLLLCGTFLTHVVEGRWRSRVTVGDLQTTSRSVALEGAESVRVEIEMGAGELTIAGGADELLEAAFTYDAPEWEPSVTYHVAGGEGRLTVRPPKGLHLRHPHYEWDLHLNNDVPMDLRVELGAGRGQLNLSNLSLTRLALEAGVGEVTVDLTGDWNNDLDARIEGGIGRATIRLPREVGVRVRARGGIGSIHTGSLTRVGDAYVNDAYGKSDVTLRLEVEGGIGQINLEVE